MKPDERELLQSLLDETVAMKARGEVLYVREWVERQPINRKRAWYLLGKWTRKGWYDYGVSLGAGWLEIDQARRALGDTQ